MEKVCEVCTEPKYPQQRSTSGSTGPFSRMPLPNSVRPGHIYIASDDNGAVHYQSDGSNWYVIAERPHTYPPPTNPGVREGRAYDETEHNRALARAIESTARPPDGVAGYAPEYDTRVTKISWERPRRAPVRSAVRVMARLLFLGTLVIVTPLCLLAYWWAETGSNLALVCGVLAMAMILIALDTSR